MKKILSIIAIISAMFALQSCDEELTYTIPAEFKLNMDINVDAMRSEQYPFAHTEVLNIADDAEVAQHIEDIKSLDVKEIECSLAGIPEGAAIEELTITIAEVGLTVTLTDITADYTLILPVSDLLLDALSQYLLTNHQTTVVATGTSTYAPMTFRVKLNFHTNVEAPL